MLPDVTGSFDSPALRASFFVQIRRSPRGTTKPCCLFDWKGACFCDDGAGQRNFLDVVWMMEFTWSKDLHKTNKLISMTHLKHIYKTCYKTCAHIWYVYTVYVIYIRFTNKSYSTHHTLTITNTKLNTESQTRLFFVFVKVSWSQLSQSSAWITSRYVDVCRIIDINLILKKTQCVPYKNIAGLSSQTEMEEAKTNVGLGTWTMIFFHWNTNDSL